MASNQTHRTCEKEGPFFISSIFQLTYIHGWMDGWITPSSSLSTSPAHNIYPLASVTDPLGPMFRVWKQCTDRLSYGMIISKISDPHYHHHRRRWILTCKIKLDGRCRCHCRDLEVSYARPDNLNRHWTGRLSSNSVIESCVSIAVKILQRCGVTQNSKGM